MSDTWKKLNNQFAGSSPSFKSPKYRSDPYCDNQLGHIHNIVRQFVPLTLKVEKLKLTSINSNIQTANHLVDCDLAIKVRQFLNDIPFDADIERLDDLFNQPRRVVYHDC